MAAGTPVAISPSWHVDQAYQCQNIRFCMLIVLCLAVYDWLLSLDREYALIWSRPKAWKSKTLFSVMRYFGFAVLIYNLVIFSGTWTADHCRTFIYVSGVVGCILAIAIQATMVFGIQVLYNHSPVLLIANVTFCAIQLTAMNGMVAADILATYGYMDTPIGLSGCISTNRTGIQGLVRHVMQNGVCFQLWLNFLVVYAGWKNYKVTGRWLWGIMGVMVKNSLAWFLVTFLGTLWCLMIWEVLAPTMITVGTPLFYSTATIGGCRIMLDIQSNLYSSQVSDLDHTTGANNVTLGTVGQWRVANPRTTMGTGTWNDRDEFDTTGRRTSTERSGTVVGSSAVGSPV